MIKSLNQSDCELILSKNNIGHLAYIYLNRPYVVPITYHYTGQKIICYSAEGHKINALRKHNAVAFEVAEILSINKWQSVVVHGYFEELGGSNAKAALHEFSLGVKDVVLRKELRDLDFINEFSSKIEGEEMPVIFVINIEEITGKIRHS